MPKDGKYIILNQCTSFLNNQNMLRSGFLIFILLSSLLNGHSQIPKTAHDIARSILPTRLQCESSRIILEDSIFYDYNDDSTKSEKEKETYFFNYSIQFNDDWKDFIAISIHKDLSIKYVSGVPHKNYSYSPCTALTKKQLWEIARKHGFRSRYKNCSYSLYFLDDRLTVAFHEKRSRWDIDMHKVDAHSGEYLGGIKMNVTF